MVKLACSFLKLLKMQLCVQHDHEGGVPHEAPSNHRPDRTSLIWDLVDDVSVNGTDDQRAVSTHMILSLPWPIYRVLCACWLPLDLSFYLTNFRRAP